MELQEIIDDTTPVGRALNLIGKVGAPTGIVAVFCTLLSLNSLETSIISLVTIFLTLIIIFFEPLSRKVPSAVVMIVLLILSTIFFFGYQNIIIKDTGLVKYWKPSSKIIGEIPEKIKNSKSEIWFYGTNFHITAEDDKQLILEKLSQGLRVRYLIFNPYSVSMNIVAKDFNQPESKLRIECIEGLFSLIDLEQKWHNSKKNIKNPGELEIRLYDELPRLRAYIFDPSDANSECFYVPYLHKVNSPELPAFQFKNHKDGVFEDYFSSIVKLWQVSSDLNNMKIMNRQIDTLYNRR